MRQVSPMKLAVSLYESLAESGSQAEADIRIKNFLLVLKKHKNLRKADKIIKLFGRYFDEKNGLAEVELTSAIPLNEETRRQVTSYLEKHYHKKIVSREKIDPSLLGGLKVRYQDEVIDGSLRHKLEDLRNKIS